MTAQLIALLLATSCSVMADHTGPGHGLFQTLYSPWSSCSRINASQDCFRTREAVCVRIRDNATAPWYYCDPADRYATVEACPSGCVQNCAVSEWGRWSPCNCSLHLYRNRSRSVLSPPRNGGQPCPGLLERSVCDCAHHLPFDEQPRRYTWRTGPWGECSALDQGTGCGNGLRRRFVRCVDVNRSVVPDERCLQESAYSRLHPPSSEMLCEIPCPCILEGEWGEYSSCNPLCDNRPLRGKETRSKSILQFPTLDQACNVLTESRDCAVSVGDCPTYVWETSGWSPCMFQPGAMCGAGHRTRYAYCVEVRDGTESSVVEDSKCERLAENTTKPLLIQSCQASCPQSCQVGEWSEWTECPRECQETHSNRTRRVLVPPLEGEVCPHTTEFRPCPALPCARYLVGDVTGNCFLPNRSAVCGEGTDSRPILCVGPNDEPLDSRECSHLEFPDDEPQVIPCIIPCPNDCVVSGWSEWSPCSESCGGRIGNQTRTRHFVAQGTNCPYTETNLTESRVCSEAQECEVTRYYIREEPWTACVPREEPIPASGATPERGLLRSDEPGGSNCARSGVRNKTSVCMRNSQVVPTVDCPFEFQHVQFESCELPCQAECVLSEWTPYSACSASCGPGMRYRSKRLLQFPTSDLSDCGVSEDDLAEDGLVVEMEACEVQPCEVLTWFETPWSSCTLYASGSAESGSCGLGFETRNVTCVEVGTRVVVPESQCSDAIGPRPPTIHGCHRQCPDRCLVTEWSEFSTCEFGASTVANREVVPHIGCSHLQDCCPELSTIETSQSFSCPSFQTDRYIFSESSGYGQCILDSPTATCGNGQRYRNTVCIDLRESVRIQANVVVDRSFCIMAGRQEVPLTEPCSIKCNRNCIQSEWGDWGPCSVTCGSGTRSRMRTMTKQGEEGGRPCGPEMETGVCVEEISCPYAEVTLGTFGPCTPTNSTSICGLGWRTREPLCTINREPRDYSECVNMGVMAAVDLTEPCVAACPGKCVAGEWEAWSPCNTGDGRCLESGSCQQHRRRELLREGSGMCMTQETRFCNLPESLYMWVTQNWTDCVIDSPNSGGTSVATRGHYCGAGIHSRNVLCVETASGDVVPDFLCTEAGLVRPILKERCTIPCPVDCVVGAFSDWSECETCAFNSQQQRARPVIVEAMFGGEECPEVEQTRPCVPTNCSMFHQDSHMVVSTDYTVDTQCGSTSYLQTVSCRTNTMFMSPSECRVMGDAPQEMQMDLPCRLEPNCTFGDWSDWSECLSLCHNPRAQFSFRTRPLVSFLPGLAMACAAEQYQQMECALDEIPEAGENGTEITIPTNSMPNCIDFLWHVSEWNQAGRNVYCSSNTGIRVEDSGCPHAIMPRSRNETCEGPCPSHATCSDEEGVCVITCEDISEKVQGACLPLVGCFNDDHCLLPHRECNSQGACDCEEGYEVMVRLREKVMVHGRGSRMCIVNCPSRFYQALLVPSFIGERAHLFVCFVFCFGLGGGGWEGVYTGFQVGSHKRATGNSSIDNILIK